MSSSTIDIIDYRVGWEMATRIAGDKEGSCRIAIIGGGFSGAALAAQLLSAGQPSVSVILIGRDGCPGRGVAYSTRCEGHLLNVPAQNMSAFAHDRDHFLRWARLHYGSDVRPDEFLPRRSYGQYVASILQKASEGHNAALEWRQDEAISVNRANGRAEIALLGGDRIAADKIILALGNFPPGDPKLPGRKEYSPRYVPNGWAESALDHIREDKSVLLLGSGLTSVDVAISLRERKFEGKIHILSRHGLLPQEHKRNLPRTAWGINLFPCTARGLLRLVRARVREAEEHHGDWRAVIDSLRPFTQRIWQSLPLQEQRRFLRHLRSYWDVHRHRVAPEIGALLSSELRDCRIEVHAGRVTKYHENPEYVEVTYRDRKKGESRKLHVHRVINCTGPELDCRRVTNPLWRDLIHQKLVRPDPLFLGLDTAQNGAVIDAHGISSDFLYAIGPLRKGSLWETIAVPEIRAQVSALALHLLSSFEQQGWGGLARELTTAQT